MGNCTFPLISTIKFDITLLDLLPSYNVSFRLFPANYFSINLTELTLTKLNTKLKLFFPGNENFLEVNTLGEHSQPCTVAAGIKIFEY